VITVHISGRGTLEIAHLVLDLNGTLATDGVVPAAVIERLQELSQLIQVTVLTADTFGTAAALGPSGVRVMIVGPGDQVEAKVKILRGIGAAQAVAIGNGMIDEGILREAALGILVVGAEGAAVRSLLAADVVVISIVDALDLLRIPKRLLATLRTA
jgi:soluble P-type ATPase